MTPGESGSSNRFERHLQGESGCLRRGNHPRGERLPQGKATAPGEGDSVEESDCPGGEWPWAAVRATTPEESDRPWVRAIAPGESDRPRGRQFRGERPPQGKTVSVALGLLRYARGVHDQLVRHGRQRRPLLDVVLDGGAHLERQVGVVLRCLHDVTAFPAAGEAGGKRNDSAAPRSAQSRALSA